MGRLIKNARSSCLKMRQLCKLCVCVVVCLQAALAQTLDGNYSVQILEAQHHQVELLHDIEREKAAILEETQRRQKAKEDNERRLREHTMQLMGKDEEDLEVERSKLLKATAKPKEDVVPVKREAKEHLLNLAVADVSPEADERPALTMPETVTTGVWRRDQYVAPA